MNKKGFNKLIILSMLIALASALSYFDTYICSLISFGVLRYKLGFANVVIMVLLYNYDFKRTFFAVVVKSIIVGFLFGATGFVTFILSLFGSLLSFFGMYIFKKLLLKDDFTPIIGLIGGFLHPIGQMLGAIIIYGFRDFLASSVLTAPIMLILGCVTGIIVGFVSKTINKTLREKIN